MRKTSLRSEPFSSSDEHFLTKSKRGRVRSIIKDVDYKLHAGVSQSEMMLHPFHPTIPLSLHNIQLTASDFEEAQY